MQRVVCLLGPTSSGKTGLSLALAEDLPIEIINVDSAQVYHGMEIGTGMPDKAIRERIPHHLIDFLDPKTPYSAAQFREDALALIKDILARKKIPLLVGGTMYYFKALQEGLAELPASDPIIRSEIQQLLQKEGLAFLYQKLHEVDPTSAQRLGPTDTQRIMRALEVYALTQKPLSYWFSHQKKSESEYEFVNVALIPLETPRSDLHQRIADRFDEMLAQGLVEEVKALKERGDLDASLPAIRAVGYRQVWQYLQGDISFELMREQAIAATRQLAKRQLTWLRHWGHCINIDFLDKGAKKKLSDLLLK
jgi:tRNA dimethylallyltransferase